MAFVNEYISEADKKKHNFVFGNHYYQTPPTWWAVDKERSMYMVQKYVPSSRDPEADPRFVHWAFFWQGHLLKVETFFVSHKIDRTEKTYWLNVKIISVRGLPKDEPINKQVLLQDLQEATCVVLDRTPDSPFKSHTVTIDKAEATAFYME